MLYLIEPWILTINPIHQQHRSICQQYYWTISSMHQQVHPMIFCKETQSISRIVVLDRSSSSTSSQPSTTTALSVDETRKALHAYIAHSYSRVLPIRQCRLCRVISVNTHRWMNCTIQVDHVNIASHCCRQHIHRYPYSCDECAHQFATPFDVIMHCVRDHSNKKRTSYRFSIDNEANMMLILSVKQCFGEDAMSQV